MSRFCGKCDFYDSIHGRDEEYFKNTKVYIDGKLLDIKSEKDCIPYYAHIVGIFAGSKNGGTYELTSYPWLRLERVKYGILTSHYYYKKELNEELIKNGMKPLYSEDECNKNFWSHTDFGPLFLEITLFKDWKNDTFICKDKLDNKYLVRTLDKYEGSYIIANLEDKDFLNLLKNKITMEQAFRISKKIYMSKYNIDEDSLNLKERIPMKIGKKHLPKPTLYIKDKVDKIVVDTAIKIFE